MPHFYQQVAIKHMPLSCNISHYMAVSRHLDRSMPGNQTLRNYLTSSCLIMNSIAIISRQLLKGKLLLFCIAVYAFVLLYSNISGINFFQGKTKEKALQKCAQDIQDQDRLEEIKGSIFEKKRHTIYNATQAQSPRGSKIKENQNIKEKSHEYDLNSKQEKPISVTNPDKEISFLRNTEVNTGKVINTSCKEKSILKRYKDDTIHSRDNIACKPHTLSAEACKFTKEVYKIDWKLQTCRENSTDIYCHLKHENSLDFDCNNIDTHRYCKISGLDKSTGDMEILKTFVDTSKLALHLKSLATAEITRKNNFLFLQCFPNNGSQTPKTQLILLPFNVKKKPISRKHNKVNMNIVLLDSISRTHFYRSLPVVLQTFNDINSDVKSKAEVLDFELFQAVHGHSAENFHAFFTGELLPENMTTSEREHSSVGVENLYGILKKLGYETMYQDDLCWKYWWGIRMELGMAANWRELQRKIRASQIDHTGLTFASCKILEQNNLQTPFNGPDDSQICLNGRFQHSYVFEHLLQYFKRKEQRKPRISFTTINTGHDYKGVRAQTLNMDLSLFVRKLSTLENTLTILMADHGNTYTTYASTMLEGRFEMHHPTFFMILTESIKKRLGIAALANLRRNTKRLFTMVDVHKTILDIATGGNFNMRKSRSRSLLSLLPAVRQCHHLELALPNLCICEGWDTPARNDTAQVGLLEFAVGILNNLIDLGRKEGRRNNFKKQWSCNRLFARSFRNVRERSEKGDLITTMDFVTDPGRGSGHTDEVFHVEIKSTIAHGRKSRDMVLLSYDRLSQYGIYRRCKDPGVAAKLCICSFKGFENFESQNLLLADGSINIPALLRNQPQLHDIPSMSTIQNSMLSECIILYTRDFIEQTKYVDNSYTTVVEIINICSKGNIYIHLDIETKNCETSRNFPMLIKTEAQSITFVAVIIRTVWYWPSSYRIFTLPAPGE